jgi:rubredoxin
MEVGVVTNFQCRKCGGAIQPGKVLEPVYGGIPDFIGGEVCTVSPVGSRLADCLKCAECGHSFIPADGVAS